MLDNVKRKIARVMKAEKQKNLAVFIDGPNILRKELGIEIREIKKIVSKIGEAKIAKVFLNQFATEKLIEAIANEGFEPVITIGDVDVAMAVEATAAAFNPFINTIVYVTRDSDFVPSIIKAKSQGKETVALIVDSAAASALKNTADKVFVIGEEE
ncbi:MAG: NYN domain-containing protein [Candidatus Diapherotrites archaeon]|nr:NYN domain-containing protein [Candidatus Diapherotrites archaeon]